MIRHIDRKWILLVALCLPLVLPGCSVHKAAGTWDDGKRVADGSDEEWAQAPQYNDAKREMTIRLANDEKAIFLCASIGSHALARQMQMNGLTVWIDPAGGTERVFGIHLPGVGPAFHGPPPTGNHEESDKAKPISPPMDPGAVPIQLPGSISITYADTTGPLPMEMEAVRRTGIDVGVGQGNGGRVMVEFDIAFAAAPCLADLGPGMIVGIALQSGGAEKGGGEPPSMGASDGPGPGGGMGGPGPGGGMGGPGPGGGMGRPGPGGGMDGGPKGSDTDEFEIWIEVQLADGPVGQLPHNSDHGQ